MNKKTEKKYARALQRLTGRSYCDCLHMIRSDEQIVQPGAVQREVDRWRGLTPDLREIEREAQRAEQEEAGEGR